MKCTIQICFESEAQAHRQDTQLDNKKVTKTSPTSKVISYRQCLDLHCISIRIETLKNRAALKHTSNSELSKNWCLKTLFKLSESLKLLTSGTRNATIFKKDFLSSRSICLTSNSFHNLVEHNTSPCSANSFSISYQESEFFANKSMTVWHNLLLVTQVRHYRLHKNVESVKGL